MKPCIFLPVDRIGGITTGRAGVARTFDMMIEMEDDDGKEGKLEFTMIDNDELQPLQGYVQKLGKLRDEALRAKRGGSNEGADGDDGALDSDSDHSSDSDFGSESDSEETSSSDCEASHTGDSGSDTESEADDEGDEDGEDKKGIGKGKAKAGGSNDL